MKKSLHHSHWKWLLFVSAAIVFVVIIIYSNRLINNIAQDERKRVEIWANAISYKAQIVNETEDFFNSIKLEEDNHAKILATAIKRIIEAPLDEDLTFYQEIVSSNKTVPLIITTHNGNIDASINVPDSIANLRNVKDMGNELDNYNDITLPYYANRYLTVYYQESPAYSDLHIVIDNLVQSFFQETVINSASVPVIITDSTKSKVLDMGNIDSTTAANPLLLAQRLEKMKGSNKPIKIDILGKGVCYVFYEESTVLTKLRWFPIIELGFVIIFIVIAYLLFSVSRRFEQNRVWVGMSKETAHQLGTPISSLMAWTELLKEMDVDQSVPTEIGKDVKRLETIAQRFSKIGSAPVLENTDLISVIEEFTQYLQSRISSMVSITFNKPSKETLEMPINRYLFEWVIENLCKNSVDAMNGKGHITIDIEEDKKHVNIDITDTGKGIPAKMHKRIFYAGYTSKSRGWGLGLTLAKRIINEYHKGKLFVKSSVIDQGTTMRIQLRKRG